MSGSDEDFLREKARLLRARDRGLIDGAEYVVLLERLSFVLEHGRACTGWFC